MREERRLRMFENMVPKRTFGPKRDEVTGEWEKLHYSGKQIKTNEMGVAVARMGEAYTVIPSANEDNSFRDHIR